MDKHCILLAVLFAGGLAFPTPNDDLPTTGHVPVADEDMSIFFDHAVWDSEGRIVGGTNAPEGAYPWMVGLTTGTQRTFLCGASIVRSNRILTAAHCLPGQTIGGVLNSQLRALVGTNRLNSGGQSLALQGFALHPQYNPNTLDNDMAVLGTPSPIPMSTRVRVVPMTWDFIQGNAQVRVAGWGATRAGGRISNILQEIRLVTIDGNRCVQEVRRVAGTLNMRVPAVNPNVEVCTFVGNNRGTCNGDSGSALIRNTGNAQIGVVSWGLPCARGAPDMYARISSARAWLQNHV